MDTGAKKPPAPAPAANARQHQYQHQEALFAATHEDLLSEARGVAREFGVDVRTVAFRPDGAAVEHEFVGGVGGEETLKNLVRRTVEKDVSAMGTEELDAHEEQLRVLKVIMVRELQAAKAKLADAEAERAKRAPAEQQEMAGAAAGSSKITRID